jgi:cell division initiation protein
MDLTPQLFRDVQFTERRGAYDRDEVDAFLARVGTAVGQLQERVREAQRRFEAAEERVAALEAKRREQEDANETMQRMIETAARFADEAMKEAKDEAEKIVAGAREKADEMIAQAEEAIRRDVGATRDRLEAEIRQLERHRDELTQRVADIESHLDRERTRLRGELEELLGVLDDPERLRHAPVPGTDPEPVIVLTDSRPAPAAGAAEPEADVEDDEDLSELPPPPEDWEPPAELASAVTPEPEAETAREPLDEEPAGLFDPRGRDDGLDGGPPTQAQPVVGPGTAFGGSHLEELRRAVSDEAADDEADAAMAAFFDQDADDERARRFGRRR